MESVFYDDFVIDDYAINHEQVEFDESTFIDAVPVELRRKVTGPLVHSRPVTANFFRKDNILPPLNPLLVPGRPGSPNHPLVFTPVQVHAISTSVEKLASPSSLPVLPSLTLAGAWVARDAQRKGNMIAGGDPDAQLLLARLGTGRALDYGALFGFSSISNTQSNTSDMSSRLPHMSGGLHSPPHKYGLPSSSLPGSTPTRAPLPTLQDTSVLFSLRVAQLLPATDYARLQELIARDPSVLAQPPDAPSRPGARGTRGDRARRAPESTTAQALMARLQAAAREAAAELQDGRLTVASLARQERAAVAAEAGEGRAAAEVAPSEGNALHPARDAGSPGRPDGLRPGRARAAGAASSRASQRDGEAPGRPEDAGPARRIRPARSKTEAGEAGSMGGAEKRVLRRASERSTAGPAATRGSPSAPARTPRAAAARGARPDDASPQGRPRAATDAKGAAAATSRRDRARAPADPDAAVEGTSSRPRPREGSGPSRRPVPASPRAAAEASATGSSAKGSFAKGSFAKGSSATSSSGDAALVGAAVDKSVASADGDGTAGDSAAVSGDTTPTAGASAAARGDKTAGDGADAVRASADAPSPRPSPRAETGSDPVSATGLSTASAQPDAASASPVSASPVEPGSTPASSSGRPPVARQPTHLAWDSYRDTPDLSRLRPSAAARAQPRQSLADALRTAREHAALTARCLLGDEDARAEVEQLLGRGHAAPSPLTGVRSEAEVRPGDASWRVAADAVGMPWERPIRTPAQARVPVERPPAARFSYKSLATALRALSLSPGPQAPQSPLHTPEAPPSPASSARVQQEPAQEPVPVSRGPSPSRPSPRLRQSTQSLHAARSRSPSPLPPAAPPSPPALSRASSASSSTSLPMLNPGQFTLSDDESDESYDSLPREYPTRIPSRADAPAPVPRDAPEDPTVPPQPSTPAPATHDPVQPSATSITPRASLGPGLAPVSPTASPAPHSEDSSTASPTASTASVFDPHPDPRVDTTTTPPEVPSATRAEVSVRPRAQTPMHGVHHAEDVTDPVSGNRENDWFTVTHSNRARIDLAYQACRRPASMPRNAISNAPVQRSSNHPRATHTRRSGFSHSIALLNCTSEHENSFLYASTAPPDEFQVQTIDVDEVRVTDTRKSALLATSFARSTHNATIQSVNGSAAPLAVAGAMISLKSRK